MVCKEGLVQSWPVEGTRPTHCFCDSCWMQLTCDWPETGQPVATRADSGISQLVSDPGASFPWQSDLGQLTSHSELGFLPCKMGALTPPAPRYDRNQVPQGSQDQGVWDSRSPG